MPEQSACPKCGSDIWHVPDNPDCLRRQLDAEKRKGDEALSELDTAISELAEAQADNLKQAEIIGKHIDDMDKCAMEKRGLECDLERVTLARDDDRRTKGDLLDNLWGILYPGKTDWEYPGMVYRHVEALIGEIRAERNDLARRVEAVRAARNAYVHDCTVAVNFKREALVKFNREVDAALDGPLPEHPDTARARQFEGQINEALDFIHNGSHVGARGAESLSAILEIPRSSPPPCPGCDETLYAIARWHNKWSKLLGLASAGRELDAILARHEEGSGT